MTTRRRVVAATSSAARLLGLEEPVIAVVLVVRGDPLADLGVVRPAGPIAHVFQSGVDVLAARGPARDTPACPANSKEWYFILIESRSPPAM